MRFHSISKVVVVLALGLAPITGSGCTLLFGIDNDGGPAALPTRDAGEGTVDPRDGGGTPLIDGGFDVDGGVAPAEDAGTLSDGGAPDEDGGLSADGGQPGDAGTPVDGGGQQDAGSDPEPDPTFDFNPNWLNQDELFTCDNVPSSSPARLRRVERREWTNTVNRPNDTTGWAATAANNPFDAPSRHLFSTYSKDVTIDAATLDLYFNALSQVPDGWIGRFEGHVNARTFTAYYDAPLWCISDATADQACQDYWVYKMLEEAVLFRAPTTDEFDRVSAFLTTSISNEANINDRPDSLRQTMQAAWMMTSALFKSEMGEGAADANGRRRLSDDELERSLSHLMYRVPAGLSALWDFGNAHPTHPGWSAPPEGRLSAINDAAADGSLQDPTVIRSLVRSYAGGVDVDRFDIVDSTRGGRGEYWLATRVGDFFREWLGYGAVRTQFKDTPSATSADESRTSNLAYNNLLVGYYANEMFLDESLDDTIARVIVDDTDTIASLLTATDWRLPSNQAADVLNSRVCSDDEQCRAGSCVPAAGGGMGCYGNRAIACTTDANCVPRCGEHGHCVSSIGSNVVGINRVFNVDSNIPATPQGRWVDVSGSGRGGVLTHPAWLAAHGANFEDDPSIIHRGRWIRENLFCEDVPPLSQVMVEALRYARKLWMRS